MKRESAKQSISPKEAEAHYQLSSDNYDINSGESHLAYYREKYPSYYTLLLTNVQPKISNHG